MAAKKKAVKKSKKTDGTVIDREKYDYDTQVVKDKDGKNKRVTSNGDRIAEALKTLDAEGVKKVAKDNGLTLKDYPNAGMLRMNVGNMLRGKVRKGEKVTINGKTVASLGDEKKAA